MYDEEDLAAVCGRFEAPALERGYGYHRAGPHCFAVDFFVVQHDCCVGRFRQYGQPENRRGEC